MAQNLTIKKVMRGISFIESLSTGGPESKEQNFKGLGFALDDCFDFTFNAIMFPMNGVEIYICGFKGGLIIESKDWEPIGGIAATFELEVRLGELSRLWGVVETKNGYVGYGPKGAIPGDVLAILEGSNVPVILRRTENCFTHVGISLILGLMEGEFVKYKHNKKFDIKEFRKICGYEVQEEVPKWQRRELQEERSKGFTQ